MSELDPMDTGMEGMTRPPRFIADNRPRVRRPGPTIHTRPASGPKAQPLHFSDINGQSYRTLLLQLRGGPVAGCTRDKCYHRMAHEGGIR